MLKVTELLSDSEAKAQAIVEVRGEILMTGLRCFLVDSSDDIWKVRDIDKFLKTHPAILLKSPGLGFALVGSPWATMGGDWTVVRDVSVTGIVLPPSSSAVSMDLHVSSVNVNVSRNTDYLEVFDQIHIEETFQSRLRSADTELALTLDQRNELKNILSARRQQW